MAHWLAANSALPAKVAAKFSRNGAGGLPAAVGGREIRNTSRFHCSGARRRDGGARAYGNPMPPPTGSEERLADGGGARLTAGMIFPSGPLTIISTLYSWLT